MATMGMGAPLAGLLSSCESKMNTTADSVILLFMAGGMAHTETFDPKRHTPFRKGMEAKEILSTFPSIPTKLDGIQFSEGLENIASVMDKGTLIRSYQAADLGHILHTRHQYHFHTCYEPPTISGSSTFGKLDSQRKRTFKSSDSSFHQYRPALYCRRR